MSDKTWNLVADIGGTNARFGIEDYANTELQFVQYYSVAQYDDFSEALLKFLADVAALDIWAAHPLAACLAVACPIDKPILAFTNSPWKIDSVQVKRLLEGAPVAVINDFAAVGYAVMALKPEDWVQLDGGIGAAGKPIAVLGAGTGLGVCGLIPVGSSYHVMESEGGHVDFAPVNSEEAAVLEVLKTRYDRVSIERLLSGVGILNIYLSLAHIANAAPRFDDPKQVTEAAIAGTDSLAAQALTMFCEILASVAANFVLTYGAKGGVYIAGGIVPNFIGFLEQTNFRQRFEAKGRYQRYLEDVPVRVITKANIGLLGAIKKLNLADI